MLRGHSAVSNDGNRLTVKVIVHPQGSDQSVTAEVTYDRIEKAPAGANGTSGSWRMKKANFSENDLLMTFKSNGDELSWSTPAGEGYTAKLDGKDYPAKRSYTYNSVSLMRVDSHTIDQTGKRDGKVIGTLRMTVAPDGKKMTVLVTDKLTGRTSTHVVEKLGSAETRPVNAVLTVGDPGQQN